MVMERLLGKLFQDDADHGDDAGDGRGAQQLHPAAAPANAGQGNDPAGDAGAQNAAQDHGDGLAELHESGIDKTNHHDGRGRGGLDHRRDQGAQQDPLRPVAGQAVQDHLQLVAGRQIQPVAHERNAVQEQRQSAQQGDQIQNAHQIEPPFQPCFQTQRLGRGRSAKTLAQHTTIISHAPVSLQ